jgi:hypothetical protein
LMRRHACCRRCHVWMAPADQGLFWRGSGSRRWSPRFP